VDYGFALVALLCDFVGALSWCSFLALFFGALFWRYKACGQRMRHGLMVLLSKVATLVALT
jgi:hypothetical protein